jgi:hypothetical protein
VTVRGIVEDKKRFIRTGSAKGDAAFATKLNSVTVAAVGRASCADVVSAGG